MKMKRQLALLVISALLAGLLPVENETVSKAAEGTARADYGLNNPTINGDGVTTWDCVWFGNYWQEDTNGDGKADKNDEKQPIKWRVLSVDGDDAFLLADKNLDCQKFNDIKTDVTWKTCTLRSWLNGYGAEVNQEGKDYSSGNFLDYAFTPEEQSAVRTTNVDAVSDKVYLLSSSEVFSTAYGFPYDYHTDNITFAESRRAKNTKYAREQGAYTSLIKEYPGNGMWWLRSLARYGNSACLVDEFGTVFLSGTNFNEDVLKDNEIAVRPVLHLNLLSVSSWSYAGTVTSKGEETEPEAVTPTPVPTHIAQASYGLNNPTIDSDGVTTWDCVWFGNYWQEDMNGDGKADKNDEKQPIKWRVLSVDGDDAFLLADKNLDYLGYNDEPKSVTWKTCTLRSWLNGYGARENTEGKDYSSGNFFNYAFTSAEQSAISTTNVVNNNNPYYGTHGGNSTFDKVYLLSIGEVSNPVYGFPSDYDSDTESTNAESRRAKYTEYVKGQKADTNTDSSSEYACNWWLRTPGHDSNNASYVNGQGFVYRYGNYVSFDFITVRPALHLKLSSASSWSYAGTVISKGEETEPEASTPIPTQVPTVKPTSIPTQVPTVKPTSIPTQVPTVKPTPIPTQVPTVKPTPIPTQVPTVKPTSMPTARADYGLNNPTINGDGVTTWDCVWFGNYWQEDTNGDGKADKNDEKQPIKWRVLSVDGDDAFLLADKNLDCQKYNDTWKEVTWETCTMRSWLNGYGAASNKEGKDYGSNNFLNNAFSAGEQSVIGTTYVVNNDNFHTNIEGGNDTSDKVYLLSLEEVMNPIYGFSADYSKYDESRRAKNTEYAKTQDAWTNTSGECAGNGFWLLRSPGFYSFSAADVDGNGYVCRDGNYVYIDGKTVRPALHLNLSSVSSWSYAGTVNSEGEEIEATPSPAPTVKPTTTPETENSPSPTSPPVSPEPTEESNATPTPVPNATPTLPPAAQPDYGLNNPTIDSDGVSTWDCVWFGNYWQEDTNGDGKADKNDEKQPIKWRVLSVDGDDAFLLADKSLDCQKYDYTFKGSTWKTCTMRSWLNGYGARANKEGRDYSSDNFLDEAFTPVEQSLVQTTNVVNNDNPEYGTKGGDDTSDQVYLLSIDEVSKPAYGFSADYSTDAESRRAKNTEYAKEQGAATSDSAEYTGNGTWWLRSPGHYNVYATFVNYFGIVLQGGHDVSYYDTAVRPALHLKLSSVSSWSYAGTVTSKEAETGEASPTPSPTVEPNETPTPAPTVIPSATPNITQEAETPFVSVSPTQTITPVLQPSASPAVTSVGKVVSVKLKQKKKTVTASWKKVPEAAGYQIQYSTSKKWKGKKQKLFRKNKVTVKNLKKKKTYYFRVRAYRLEGTKKVYGAWSKTKRIKMKK